MAAAVVNASKSSRGFGMYSMRPVGFVRTPFRETSQIPKGFGAKHEAEGSIELEPEFEEGLLDIEGFSHLYVIWVFHESEGYALTGTPPRSEERRVGKE